MDCTCNPGTESPSTFKQVYIVRIFVVDAGVKKWSPFTSAKLRPVSGSSRVKPVNARLKTGDVRTSFSICLPTRRYPFRAGEQEKSRKQSPVSKNAGTHEFFISTIICRETTSTFPKTKSASPERAPASVHGNAVGISWEHRGNTV